MIFRLSCRSFKNVAHRCPEFILFLHCSIPLQTVGAAASATIPSLGKPFTQNTVLLQFTLLKLCKLLYFCQNFLHEISISGFRSMDCSTNKRQTRR